MTLIVPQARDALIDFYDAHQPVWEVVFASIGITAEQAALLKTAIETAKTKRSDAISLRDQSKSATSGLNDAVEDLRTLGAGLMSTIRAYAETTGNPEVYQKALIPPPKPASPLPPPAMPTNVHAELRNDGTIEIRWDGSIANGTVYTVKRAVDMGAGPQPWVSLGTFGSRTIVDTGVPTCTVAVSYQVYGVRGTQTSPASPMFTLRFAPVGGEGAGEQGGAQSQAA